MFKKLLIAAGLLVAASAPAWSQAGQFPSGWVHGNATASAGQAQPSSVTSILDRALGSTRGSILERGSAGWSAVNPSATAGLPWVSGGTGADPLYQLLGAVGGGTGNAFFQVSGPASSIKTYTFPNANSTMAALATIQTWTGAQSFTDGDLILLGASSGSSTLKAPATGGGTATLFAGSDTIAGLAATQTFTNKTFASSTDVLGGVTMTLGSDATGDIYYRNGSGILTRLPIGSGTQVLGVSAGIPAWTAAGAGNVSNSGAPTANQIAQWTSSTQIQGISTVAPAQGGTGVASPTAHGILVGEGSSNVNSVGPGTLGQFDAAQGASADPSFVSGPWTLLATLTASNSTTLSDTTHITSSYNEYEISFEDIIPATNASSCELQLYIGGTLQTSGYQYSNTGSNTGGAAVAQGSTSSTFIPCSFGSSAVNTAPGISGSIRITRPSVSTIHGIFGQFFATGSTGAPITNTVAGYYGTAGTITGINVLISSGNITSGNVKIYGRL